MGRVSVLLIGDSLRYGGTEGQFVEVARGIERRDWDVHVTCLRAEGRLRPRLEDAGLRPWSCGPGSLRSPRLLSGVVRLARAMRLRGITVSHSFDFYSNVLGVLAARLARVPVVIASQRDLGNLRPPFQQRLHRWVLRRADAVTVNSPAIAARLIDQGTLPSPRVILIQNGIDLHRFRPSSPAARPATVMTLGNLRPEKGHADFVEAAGLVHERFPHAAFEVWGDGPLRRTLQAHINRLGLDGVVALHGETSQPELVLGRAGIFVLPSRSEATSNVLLEAMATGLPVLATRVGGTPWVIEDEVSGLLVPPGDPAALGKAIIRLLESPDFANALAERAISVVRDRYGIDAMVTSIESGYRTLLARIDR